MKILLLLLSLIFVTPSISLSDEANSLEIFSKSDATAMFEMSLEDWKQNVIGATQSGAADYDTDGNLEYTMKFAAPNGVVFVTPSYSERDKKRPWKLTVRILFQPMSGIGFLSMNDSELKNFIAEIYKEMLPEYTVFSSFFFSGGRVMHSAEMFEFGFDAIMDEGGKNKLGCFQDCIQRLPALD